MLWVVLGDDRRSRGILAGRSPRPIDPNRCRQGFGAWGPLHEPLRMGEVRGQAGAVSDLEDEVRDVQYWDRRPTRVAAQV